MPVDRESPEKRAACWHSAVRRGSFSLVSSALAQQSSPVNEVDSGGFTALMRCCVSGQLLSLLLEHAGVDVNASGAPDGSTALLLACRSGSPT
eukprot:scaffold7724_cov27-Tisochrysis_lutea.AAC.1